jgi:uncharacterized membrane protein YfcA
LQLLVQWLGYLGVGLLVGTFSGLFGVGGGVIMVPLIVLIWKHDVKIAIGTSLAAMVPTSFVGAARHYGLGNVNLHLAACLAVGAALGTAFIGAPLVKYLPSELLKKMFGIVMIVSGLQWSGLVELVKSLFVHSPTP